MPEPSAPTGISPGPPWEPRWNLGCPVGTGCGISRLLGDAPLTSRPFPPLSMFQTLYSYFWWERLWLPANLTWADLEDRDGRVYAKASDLYITLPLAFVFLIVRHLFET